MPSEKSRYLKNQPKPPFYHDEIQKHLKSVPRQEVETLLINFSSRNEALRKTLIVLTAIAKFNESKDYKMLSDAFKYTLSLQGHIDYDKAGQYSNVTYPVVEFFKNANHDNRLMEILEEVLPILEESSYLLQDEGSWYEAHEELGELLSSAKL